MNIPLLEKYGIDGKKGLERCFNDETIYTSLLSAFLSDTTFARAKDAYTNNDFDALFKCAHELKGASGSATLTALFEATSALVEYLKRGNAETYVKSRIDALFAAMAEAYSKTREGVAAAIA